MLSLVVVVAATALSVSRSWPQITRILTRRTTAGVSALTWSLSLVSTTSWTVLGVVLDLPFIVASNALSALGSAAVLLTLSRHGQLSRWRSVWVATAAVATTSAMYAQGGTTLVSSGLTVLAAVVVAPQVVKAWRSDPSGISPTTWWMFILACVLWSVYYLTVDQPALVLPNLITVPMAALILLRVHTYRGRDRPSPSLPTFTPTGTGRSSGGGIAASGG